MHFGEDGDGWVCQVWGTAPLPSAVPLDPLLSHMLLYAVISGFHGCLLPLDWTRRESRDHVCRVPHCGPGVATAPAAAGNSGSHGWMMNKGQIRGEPENMRDQSCRMRESVHGGRTACAKAQRPEQAWLVPRTKGRGMWLPQ